MGGATHLAMREHCLYGFQDKNHLLKTHRAIQHYEMSLDAIFRVFCILFGLLILGIVALIIRDAVKSVRACLVNGRSKLATTIGWIGCSRNWPEIAKIKLMRRWMVVETEQWKFFLATAVVGLAALLVLDFLIIPSTSCPWPIGQASLYLLSAIPQTLGALIGVGFAMILVGFQVAASTFSKRAAKLLVSSRLVLISLAAFLVTIVHSLFFLALQKEIWPVSQMSLHAGCLSSLIGAIACAILLGGVFFRVKSLLTVKGLLKALKERWLALVKFSTQSENVRENRRDFVKESELWAVFGDLAHSSIRDRDPWIIEEASETLEHIVISSFERYHELHQSLEAPQPGTADFLSGLAEGDFQAIYAMISTADLACSEIAGQQGGYEAMSANFADSLMRQYLRKGLAVLDEIAIQCYLRGWQSELQVALEYVRRVYLEGAYLPRAMRFTRWAKVLRRVV